DRRHSHPVFDSEFLIEVDPGGIAAISRGLSAATPPVRGISNCTSTPDGVAAPILARLSLTSKPSLEPRCWHPSGMQSRLRFTTGDIASLNPRPIAGTPAGVATSSSHLHGDIDCRPSR